MNPGDRAVVGFGVLVVIAALVVLIYMSYKYDVLIPEFIFILCCAVFIPLFYSICYLTGWLIEIAFNKFTEPVSLAKSKQKNL